MNLAILQPEVQEWLREHQHDDPVKVSLGKSPFAGITAAELATQLDSRKRAEKKLPEWFSTKDIYYPPKLALEQCSSSLTAAYKQDLILGNSVADLTGGFGVDSYFFALKASTVTHVEQQADLSDIASHNFSKLGITEIRCLNKDGLSSLAESDAQFDTIYLDPSRRVKTQKVFKLADCEPDVIRHLDLLKSRCKRLIIKTSPILDITQGLTELEIVDEIHILSLKNEVKEVLWVINSQSSCTDPIIVAVALDKPDSKVCFSRSEEFKSNSEFSFPQLYVYEPDAALLKAGAFKWIGAHYDVFKLHQHSHLYTSEDQKPFLGRTFKVQEILAFKAFQQRKIANQANVISRNFPLSADKLRKKFKIKDGSDRYLIFSTTGKNELIVIDALRLF